MLTEIVIDTSALIEYLDATRTGALVRDIVEDQGNLILAPAIVLAELSSKLSRRNQDVDNALKIISSFITPVDIAVSTYIKAGKSHAALRKIEKDFPLADCLIIQVAEEHGNALILTTDPHFKHYKNSKIL